MLSDCFRRAINVVVPRERKNKSGVAKCFLAGYSTVNPPAVPFTNKFLSFFYTRNRFSLISFLLFLLSLSGLVLAAALAWTSCAGANNFPRIFLMAVRQLMGWNAAYLEDGSSAKGTLPLECLAVAAFGDFFALLIQIALVGLCTSCFIKAQTILEVSSSVVTLSRDGEKRMAIRLAHPQGHLVTHCHGEFVWVRPRQSAEGESFHQSCTLGLCDMRTSMIAPFTFAHVIDARSPLFPYRHDLASTPGQLYFFFTGQDYVLGCTAVGFQIFEFSDIRQNHIFSDIILVTPTAAALAGTKTKINLGPLHETREIESNHVHGSEVRLVADTSTADRDRPEPLPPSIAQASTIGGALLLPSMSRSNLAESGEPGIDVQHAERLISQMQDEPAFEFQHRSEEARIQALQALFESEKLKITQEYEGKLEQLTSQLAIEVRNGHVPRADLASGKAAGTKLLEDSAVRTESKLEAAFVDFDTWFAKSGGSTIATQFARRHVGNCTDSADAIHQIPVKAMSIHPSTPSLPESAHMHRAHTDMTSITY